MIKYIFTKQFIGFLAVGGLAAFLHWLARILISLWLPFSLAIVLAYIVGMATAFLLNRVFVFRKSEKSLTEQARGFVLINLLFFPIVWYAAITINDGLRTLGFTFHTEEISHAIAVALPMIVTFLFYKLIAFRDVPNEQ